LVNNVDLSVTKTVDDATPNAGQTVEFTVTVSNSAGSNASATGVQLTDTYTAGLTGAQICRVTGSVDCTSGTDYAAWTNPVNVGTISAGGSDVYKIRATATGTPLSATNTASVSANASDPSTANNTTSASTLVNNVDLSVTKTVDDATPNAGQTVEFTVTVSNSAGSNASATGVQLTDTYTAGLTGAQICRVTGSVDCTSGTDYAAWTNPVNVGTISAGGSDVYKIRATATGTPLSATNTASVSANASDPSTANNTTSASTLVNNVDLSVTKTVDDATPNAGQTVEFTVTVSNSAGSNASATGVQLTDTYTAGLTGAQICRVTGSVDCTSGTDYAAWTNPVNVGTIAAGGSVVYKIRATATGTPLSATNTASVSANESDPSTANNTASASTLVNNVDDATPNAGQTVEFTVTVSNSAGSNASATGVQLTDTYTAGLTGAQICRVTGSVDCTSGTDYAAWTNPVNVGTIAAGGSVVYKIRATATGTPLSATNTASVS